MQTKYINSAATTNGQRVKQSAATLGALHAFNAGAGVAFVKLYDKAAAPTVGTDTPVLVFAVPAGGNVIFDPSEKFRFVNGMGLAITGAAADSDTTAVAANQVKVALSYGG